MTTNITRARPSDRLSSLAGVVSCTAFVLTFATSSAAQSGGTRTAPQVLTPPPVSAPPSAPVVEEAPLPGDPQPPATSEATSSPVPHGKAPGPCEVASPRKEQLLDRYRREIFETICESAARFDHVFGDRRFDEEARKTSGRLNLRLIYDEHDGFEPDGKLNVNVHFPNLDHRVNAFFGRDDRDDFVRGRDNRLDFLPTFFRREGDEEWLAGFGYQPVHGDRDRVDFDAGVQGGSPIETFARARYRHYNVIGAKNLLRARQTVYWTNERDFGTSTRIDLERPFGERTLARWSTNATIDGETQGTDWDTGVTLYHGFTPARAVAWYVGVNGETGRTVPLQDYGTSVTYRQQMFRDWFFGELITGVTWPKERIDEERAAALHIGFGFEIQFSGEALHPGQRNR